MSWSFVRLKSAYIKSVKTLTFLDGWLLDSPFILLLSLL